DLKMKKLVSLILALAIAFSLVSCGNSDAPSGENTPDAAGESSGTNSELFPERTEDITLTFWHSITNETIYAAFKEVLDDFNNGVGAERGIYVEDVQYPSAAELNTAVTAAIMSNSAPDLVTGTPIYM